MQNGDLRPAALFIPREQAWLAVQEFIQTDGALPTAVEWISNDDLPPNSFPDALAEVPVIERRPGGWQPER